jgi:hypothetical protein
MATNTLQHWRVAALFYLRQQTPFNIEGLKLFSIEGKTLQPWRVEALFYLRQNPSTLKGWSPFKLKATPFNIRRVEALS